MAATPPQKLPVFELGDIFFETGRPVPEGDCSVREGQILEPRQVTVHAPEWRKSGLGGHHVYKITTAPSIVNHVFRRYSDFVWLRDLLCRIFPGVFIPPLPPKKILSSNDDIFISERRDGLQRFLTRCLMQPLLVRSAPFQTFLSRAQTFQEACKELSKNAGVAYGKMKRLMGTISQDGSGEDAAEIVRQYRDLFREEMETPLAEDAEEKVAELTKFLQETEKKLRNLVESCAAMHSHMQGVATDLQNLHLQLDRLHTAEKGYPSLPQPPRLNLLKQVEVWSRTTSDIALPPYSHPLLRLFRYELRDVEAFLELLRARTNVLNRYNKAVRKAERWRNAASQAGEDEKQRAQRQLDLAREEEEKDLLDALTKLVLGSQVRYLWTQKTAAFERAWAKFAQEQLRASEIQARNWESALDLIQDNSAAHTGPLLHAGDLENPNQQQQDQKSFSSAAAEQHYPDFVESSQESSNSPVAGDGVVDDGDDDGRGSGKAGILSKEYRNSDAVIETPAPDGDDPGGEEEEEEEEEIVFGGGLLGEGEEDDQLFRPVQEQGKDGEGPEDGIEVDF